MATLKLGLEDVSALDLVPYAQGIHDAMQLAPHFPAPVPSFAVFQATINALLVANAAAISEGGRSDFQAKRIALSELRHQVKRMGAYVSLVADDDESIILSSGFGVRRKAAPVGELERPSGLISRLTRTTGRVDLDWAVVPSAKMYNVYMCTSGDPFKWQLLSTTTKSRYNANDLVCGTYYWFAVTAIGTAGETSKSEPLRAMAAA